MRTGEDGTAGGKSSANHHRYAQVVVSFGGLSADAVVRPATAETLRPIHDGGRRLAAIARCQIGEIESPQVGNRRNEMKAI